MLLLHQVPAEFQTQYPSYANPPTLVLALTKYIAKLKARTDSTAS
jgi:mannosyl-oligosaccharide glucosidase